MKAFVLFFALLLTPAMLAAQSFELSITPSVQSVKLGETAIYSIVIKPLNGYDATVFLSTATTSFKGSVTYSNYTPNPPYENITLQIKPTFQDTGIRTIKIYAQNGDVKDSVTCSIISTTEQLWAKLPTPQPVDLGSGMAGTLQKDKNGDICFVIRIKNNLYINHFRNRHWETDTIPLSVSTYVNPPFAYDKNGVFWLGTKEGIARLNGKFTTIYNTYNSSIGSNVIRQIVIDRDGFPVCVAKEDGEDTYTLSRYDGKNWRNFKNKMYGSWDWGYDFVIDSLNKIWIPIPNGLAVIQDTAQWTYTTIPTSGNGENWQLLCDKDNWIWCLHYPKSFMPDQSNLTQNVISYFDGKSWKHIKSPTKYRVANFILDADKNIWLASHEGLHFYNGTNWTTYDKDKSPLHDPDGPYGYTGNRLVIQDSYKNLWFMTNTSINFWFTIFNPYGLVGIPLAPSAVEDEIQPPISGIHLAPNPTSSSLTISGIEGVRSMQMVNTLGMVVRSETLGMSSTYEVDVSNLPNGMYSMQFHTETGIISKPVVVNR